MKTRRYRLKVHRASTFPAGTSALYIPQTSVDPRSRPFGDVQIYSGSDVSARRGQYAQIGHGGGTRRGGTPDHLMLDMAWLPDTRRGTRRYRGSASPNLALVAGRKTNPTVGIRLPNPLKWLEELLGVGGKTTAIPGVMLAVHGRTRRTNFTMVQPLPVGGTRSRGGHSSWVSPMSSPMRTGQQAMGLSYAGSPGYLRGYDWHWDMPSGFSHGAPKKNPAQLIPAIQSAGRGVPRSPFRGHAMRALSRR